MTTILPLTRSAEALARRFAVRGRSADAYRTIRRLLARPEATGLVASRWHGLAATFCIQLTNYARALKHLRLAFQHDRTNRKLALRIAKWYDAEGDRVQANRWRKRAGLTPSIDRIPFLRVVSSPSVVKLKLFAG